MTTIFLNLIRTDAQEDRTLGELFLNGSRFCYTLEDLVRAEGVKIKGKTAIPAGLYRVKLTMSPKFGRITPQILGVENFDGVRMHGGNDPVDTEGCPLVAFNRAGNKIQGTAEAALTAKIQEAGGSCLLAIVDHFSPVPA